MLFVLFIHGPAAAGKYTIGESLAAALELPLFHNHLAVDLALRLFEFGSEEFCRLRATIWLEAFQAAAAADRSFIFTFHPESTVEPALIAKLHGIIEDSGGEVHYIELVCSGEASLQRLDDPGRARFGKLRDKALFKKLASAGAFDFPPLPEAMLRVDTENQDPAQATAEILRALKDQTGVC